MVVFALLWIDFRSLRLTAIALAQLICGVIMMLGWMKVAGIHLNYVNAFVATMILGVGIDYSIQYCLRYKELILAGWEHRGAIGRTSEETGMPCMMLENCCYDFFELQTLNMVRLGVFGELTLTTQ